MIRRYFSSDDLEVIELPGVGNRATFGRQIDLLLEQEYSELVYFAEDDYYYLPGQLATMVEFMRTHPDVHFATPYDHLDYYQAPLHRPPQETTTFEGRNWRRVGSTCLTFLTSRTVLRQTKRVFASYVATRNTDYGVWFSLTKFRVRNPLTIFAGLNDRLLTSAVVATAWFYNWRELVFGEHWNVWAPTPTIATHMDSEFLAPGYEWAAIFDQEAKALRPLSGHWQPLAP
jgi:hypothetical protein